MDNPAAQKQQIVDAMVMRLCLQPLEGILLVGVGGDDELSGPLVGNSPFFTSLVQELSAFDAQRGLQGTFGIIDSRMDDFAVAAAGLLPLAFVFFQ